MQDAPRPQNLFYISLPIKPFSVNKTYTRDRRHKTSAFRDWETAVLHAMGAASNQHNFRLFRQKFNKNTHCIGLSVSFKIPKDVFWTNDGRISSRCEDLTNIEKPLIDLLFLPKFHVQPFPYGCENFNVDDKLITYIQSSKEPNTFPKYVIEVSVEILPLACV